MINQPHYGTWRWLTKVSFVFGNWGFWERYFNVSRLRANDTSEAKSKKQPDGKKEKQKFWFCNVHARRVSLGKQLHLSLASCQICNSNTKALHHRLKYMQETFAPRTPFYSVQWCSGYIEGEKLDSIPPKQRLISMHRWIRPVQALQVVSKNDVTTTNGLPVDQKTRWSADDGSSTTLDYFCK